MLAALLAGFAACARLPIQEPLLAVSRTDCDTRPDFATAVPVRIEDQDGASSFLGEAGRCLILPSGTRTTYAVFALPPPAPAYTIEILSRVIPRTIVLPIAMVYDGSGHVIRTIPPGEFESNIAGLRAGVRPQDEARFLVVAADQGQLGQELKFQLGLVDPPVRVASTIPIFIPPVIPPTYPDFVRQRTAIFALNGRITVFASPQRSLRTAMSRSEVLP